MKNVSMFPCIEDDIYPYLTLKTVQLKSIMSVANYKESVVPAV